jgi:4-hydroxyacetophenone monooxygenase
MMGFMVAGDVPEEYVPMMLREETLAAKAVISAVGQLNRPKLPDIPGRDTFRGPSMHSARWRPEVDLAGRRVAVIGTGASAFQIVPSIAEQTSRLTVFQRSAPWMFPSPNYHAKVVPDYVCLGKRTLQDNGSWLAALRRDDVDLKRES